LYTHTHTHSHKYALIFYGEENVIYSHEILEKTTELDGEGGINYGKQLIADSELQLIKVNQSVERGESNCYLK
jgi:hypothetical protein